MNWLTPGVIEMMTQQLNGTPADYATALEGARQNDVQALVSTALQMVKGEQATRAAQERRIKSLIGASMELLNPTDQATEAPTEAAVTTEATPAPDATPAAPTPAPAATEATPAPGAPAFDSMELAPPPDGTIYACDPVTGVRQLVAAPAPATANAPATTGNGTAPNGTAPDGNGGADPIAARLSKLRRAVTRSERGREGTYVSTLSFDGRTVFLKAELDARGYKRYVSEDTRIVRDLRQLNIDAAAGKVPDDQAGARSEALLDARIANNEQVLLDCIADWEFEDAATPEEITSLPNGSKASLAMLIARASRMSEIEGQALRKN